MFLAKYRGRGILLFKGGLQPIAQLPSIFQNFHKGIGNTQRFYNKSANMAKKQREIENSSDSEEPQVERDVKPYL